MKSSSTVLYVNDTIAAIATAPGQGAVGIVRLSGVDALHILSQIFTPKNHLESHRMVYGKIYKNGKNGKEIIDEVMVCPMKAPRSYTCEDVVEIYTHGGMLVSRSVLQTVLDSGARLAQPGEFTKRAFLNGRINLSQAEAVMDIISAGSETARRVGLKQLGGGLSRHISNLRDKILLWLAHIELSIDYPEHEEEAKNAEEILGESDEVLAELNRLCDSAKIGRVLKEGVKTAIIGRPNVGKSTLLNAILKEDRAIVHEQAGTTRDVLTEHVLINDVPLMIMDTAGIRETTNQIEKMGVEKSLEAAKDAELILYVIDSHEGFLDTEFLESITHHSNIITILNKCDLPDSSITSFPYDSTSKLLNPVKISAKTGEGLEKLYAQISETFLSSINQTTTELEIITRERHRSLIEKAANHINQAIEALNQNTPEDLVAIQLRTAYIALGEILGLEIEDDIVDRIFSEFCVGK